MIRKGGHTEKLNREDTMIEESILKRAIYGFATLYLLTTGAQIWSSLQIGYIEDRIRDQIEGKLDEQARELQRVRSEVGLAKAKMVELSELEAHTQRAFERLSDETQARIEKYKDETNAQVSSLSTRIRRVDAHLTSGLADVGQKVAKNTPPPPKWKGVKKEDVDWCRQDPTKCDPFPLTWRYPTRENPVATFASESIWGDEFSLSLSLRFRVTTVGFRDKEGVVENQAVFFDVGYEDKETGEFRVLQNFSIKEGDSPETDMFFHTASVNPDLFQNNLDFFEPTLLLGASFSPTLVDGSTLNFRTGLTVAGGLINLRKGEIRIGANGVISSELVGAGAFASYHPTLFGKSFNLAPMMGVLFDSQLQTSMQVGLVYQLY
jgi:hypothetical protein